ncbi:hypothetical protein EMCRGX_G031317 [Ephydatia muelleri]
METINHQESAAPTTDSKETKTDQLERNDCIIVAGQTDSDKISPLVSRQNLCKIALVGSLSSGCFDEGELDYDESMEGDRERVAVNTAGSCEETGCVTTRDVEEGEVTSDEEGEIKALVTIPLFSQLCSGDYPPILLALVTIPLSSQLCSGDYPPILLALVTIPLSSQLCSGNYPPILSALVTIPLSSQLCSGNYPPILSALVTIPLSSQLCSGNYPLILSALVTIYPPILSALALSSQLCSGDYPPILLALVTIPLSSQLCSGDYPPILLALVTIPLSSQLCSGDYPPILSALLWPYPLSSDNEDDDDGSGNQVVSATKKGAPSRTRHLPPLESDQSRSEYRMRATEKNADREDLTSKAETTHPAVCRHFIQGKCSWGPGCRFLHHDPTEEPSNPRDFPLSYGSFSPHFPAEVASLPEYLPPLGRGHPHKAFPRPVGIDPMCPPPFLPVPEPLPLPVYRDPTLVYRGAGPRSKWGPTVAFPEVGKLKTSDVEEESDGWHRLRTVTRKWGSEDDHTHTTPSDKPKSPMGIGFGSEDPMEIGFSSEDPMGIGFGSEGLVQSPYGDWVWFRGPYGDWVWFRAPMGIGFGSEDPMGIRNSDSGAETDSSPEQGKNPISSTSSEVWTDPWARQRPSSSSHTRDKKQKRRDLDNPSGGYHGNAPAGAGSKKRWDQEVSPVPRQGVEEMKRLREGHGEEEEEKVNIKEGRSIKKLSPGEEEEGVGQTRKRRLSASLNDDSTADVEEKSTRKKGRKEGRASNRDKKLSVDSPPSSSERGGQDDDKTEKHLTTTSFHPRGHFPPRGRGRGPPTDSKCPPSSPVGRKRQAQRGGSVRAWRSELPAAPERGSSGDEGRSPTPAPSDSISSESDSGPEGAVHKTKQPKEFHHPKDVAPLMPVEPESTKGRNRQAKLLEELNAINKKIEKKRTQATRV